VNLCLFGLQLWLDYFVFRCCIVSFSVQSMSQECGMILEESCGDDCCNADVFYGADEPKLSRTMQMYHGEWYMVDAPISGFSGDEIDINRDSSVPKEPEHFLPLQVQQHNEAIENKAAKAAKKAAEKKAAEDAKDAAAAAAAMVVYYQKAHTLMRLPPTSQSEAIAASCSPGDMLFTFDFDVFDLDTGVGRCETVDRSL
jgi:hypothetical protein